jgi:hypothetical protein
VRTELLLLFAVTPPLIGSYYARRNIRKEVMITLSRRKPTTEQAWVGTIPG